MCRHCPRTAVAKSATVPSASPATPGCAATSGPLCLRPSYSAVCSASCAAGGAAELSQAEGNFAKGPVDGGRYKGEDSGLR